MKNQYFGDNRDLFKFDLIEWLAEEGSLPKRLVYVPMLTPDEPNGHGEQVNRARARAGRKNQALLAFLDRQLILPRQDGAVNKDLSLIKGYLEAKGVGTHLHRFDGTNAGAGRWITHSTRAAYFADEELAHALREPGLVLVDPDNGLEVTDPDERHLLWSEVEQLFSKMAEESILILFQYFPRKARFEYTRGRTKCLYQATTLPVFISDNAITLYLVAKSEHVRSRVVERIHQYLSIYSGLIAGELDDKTGLRLFCRSRCRPQCTWKCHIHQESCLE